MRAFTSLFRSMWRTNLRDLSTLMFSFAFPVILLVFLASQFGDLAGADGHLVVDSIGPNVIAFGTAFVGMFAAATNLVEWRKNGMMQVLRATPVRVSTILGAQMAVGMVLAFVQLAVLVLVGVSPWVGMSLSPWAPLATIGVFLGTIVFFALGMLVGMIAPSVPAASMAILVMILPMGYVSGAMMPVDLLPGWAAALASWMPLHYLLDAVAGPLTGVVGLASTLGGLGLLGALGLVLFSAATKTMRWS